MRENAFLLIICIISYANVLPVQSEDMVINLDPYEEKPPMYNKDLFEGDIIGITSHNDRSAIVDTHQLWTGGIVYYSIGDSAHNITNDLLEAFAEFENKTCLRFVERPPEVIDYIKIENANGCNSNIGRVGGAQPLNLGDGCINKGIIMHEFFHAIGFHHEQSRSDRDKYVEIIWDNIWNTTQFNFEKVDEFDNNLLDEEFDYTSLMMYEWNAWANNFSEATIVPKQPGIVLKGAWEKEGFSAGDIRKINKLYECFGQKRPAPPKVPDFVCDFEFDDCQILNQANMDAHFERRLMDIGGRKGHFLVVEPEFVASPYTRLITPYFKVYGRNETCFSLDYFLEGEGVQTLEISQQGSGTRTVSFVEPEEPQWTRHQVTLNTTGMKEMRVFVEVLLRRGAPGIAALDHFVFSRMPC